MRGVLRGTVSDGPIVLSDKADDADASNNARVSRRKHGNHQVFYQIEVARDSRQLSDEKCRIWRTSLFEGR